MSKNPTTMANLQTFGRASTKYGWNGAGLRAVFAANSPAYDFDPGTGLLRGLLLEGSDTNQIINSNTLSDWTPHNATVAQNAGTATDGTNSAFKIVESATTAQHYLTGTSTLLGNQPLLLSAEVKPAGRDSCNIVLQDSLVSGTYAAGVLVKTLNSAPAVAVQGQAGSIAGATADLVTLSNGWFRVWASIPLLSPNANAIQFQSNLLNGPSGSANANYAGDGSSGILFNFVQLEPTARRRPSSPIKTTGSPATRSADALYSTTLVDAGDGSPWFNPLQGTILLHCMLRDLAGSTPQTLIRFDDGTDNNRIVLTNDTAGNIRATIVAAGTTIFDASIGTVTARSLFFVALSYANGAFCASLNGAASVATSTAGLPTGISRVIWGAESLTGLNALYGWLKRWGYFAQAYPADTLPSITASEAVGIALIQSP
jgi:hypothetical protein